MWLEIISTAVVTSVATHLAPHAFSFLKGKFVKVQPTAKGTPVPPLGNYIVAIDRKAESTTFKLKTAPARQTTRLGVTPGSALQESVASIPIRTSAWTKEQEEEEIAEAAKDREITEEEMAAYAQSSTPQVELEIDFELDTYDPKVGVIPPDYTQARDSRPTPELVGEYNKIATDLGLKTRA